MPRLARTVPPACPSPGRGSHGAHGAQVCPKTRARILRPPDHWHTIPWPRFRAAPLGSWGDYLDQATFRIDPADPDAEMAEAGWLKPRTVLFATGALLGALLLAVVGFVLMYQAAYADRIYPGVRVLGEDLGGYSRDEARSLLENRLRDLGERRLILRFQDRAWDLNAQELGLNVDVSPVLEVAYRQGREGNFFERFWTQLGLRREGQSFQGPSAAYDQAVQTNLLQRIAREIDRSAADSTLRIGPNLKLERQPSQVGYRLEIETNRRRLADALADRGATQVELAVAELRPATSDVDTAEAAAHAERILASSVDLVFGERTWTLDPPQLASILRFHREGTRLLARLDRPALETWAKSLSQVVEQTSQEARFAWAGGALEVLRPSREARELDVKATVDLIMAKAPTDEHRLPLPVKITRPATPMEDRKSLGIKELIKTSRTAFAGSVPAKVANISLAAERLNGVVVPPGGTFSFNKELGPTTLDAGFKIGWGVTTTGGNIRTVPAVAGGICQVATTLFHSVFWAGYTIEQRNWHLYWISAYTSNGIIGLDATVDEEANLDFQFINPTKHHLLIQSWVDGAQNLNFALYGTTPDWTVKVDPPVRTETEKAEHDKIYIEEEPSMPEGNQVAVERAMDGFNVNIVRHVISADGSDRKLNLTSRYRPSRNVVLVGTGGRPAGAPKVEEVKTAPTPAPSPTANGTPVVPAAQPTASAPAAPAAAPTRAPAAPTATPVPTKKPDPPRPTATPTPKKR